MRPVWVPRWSRAALAVALGLTSPARAGSPLAISWNAPASCPAESDVVRAVTRLVRQLPAAPLAATVTITEGPAAWQAELRTSGGVRVLTGETCTALSESVVVILALSIDPGADTSSASFPLEEPAGAARSVEREGPGAVQQEPLAAQAARDERRAEPAAETHRGASPTLRLGAALRVFAELGIMPDPTLGGALAVRARRGAASAEAAVVALLPQTGSLPDDPTRGGRFSWFGGELSGCLSTRGQTQVAGCAGVEVGRLTGTGTGVDVHETRHAAWVAPLFSGRAGLPLAATLAFEAELALAVPLLRPTFALEDLGEVHTPSAVSGRVGIGFRWR